MALIFGFKMLAKLSAEPLLIQSCQEEVLCCPCTHDSLLEQNMFFCQDTLLPPPLIHFKKSNGSSTLRPHLAQHLLCPFSKYPESLILRINVTIVL